jgi:hypothetical protein
MAPTVDGGFLIQNEVLNMYIAIVNGLRYLMLKNPPYSRDGGLSFVDGGFVPVSGTYILEGDPTLGFDSAGDLYYGSLLEDPASYCSYIGINESTSTSPSVVFGEPVAISGPGSCSGFFEDKEFLQ